MESISPAIHINTEKQLKELSPEEFQQMLSAWFNEKGVLRDMKSYLKYQMINVLKHTALGKHINSTAYQAHTLAQQALHLIVAEYLLQQECHFSLSLFSTEVNLSSILPDIKLFFDSENESKVALKKFHKQNLVNILELLGISKENPYYKIIINEYFSKTSVSILGCLLSVIGNNIKKQTKEQDLKINIEYEDDFMKNVYFVLQSSILPSDIQNQLLHNIKLCYDLKTKFYESQVLQLVNKFRKELNLHEQKLQHAKRRKMHLEKKVARLEKENQILKNKFENASKEMGPMHTERERLIEQVVTFPCALDHCDINCQTAKADCDLYKKEVEKLKDINQQQKDEIERLKLSYNELLKEFNNCQTKINLVNLRLQEEIDREVQKDPYQKSKSSSSSRSQSITEEILHEARQKLRLLEEESEELDIRFQKFCIA